MIRGGEVVVVPVGRMPADSGLAATFRHEICALDVRFHEQRYPAASMNWRAIKCPRGFDGERKARLHDNDHEGIVVDRQAIDRWENEGGRTLASATGDRNTPNQYLLKTHHWSRSMTTARTFKTRIELPADRREKLITLLNQHLADTFDLFSQTKQAHWNVKGPQFFSLHELFDKLAEELEGYVDMIAERATALGGLAHGTVRMAAEASRLTEYPLDAPGSLQHLEALAVRFAALAATTRSAIDAANDHGDADTADLFTEVSRALDKGLWFLEAHLQA
jgi:starvation-inducible DNA-binding protein